MKIWKKINEFKIENNTAIALGAFDGLHKGHLEVLQAVLNSKVGQASVFTFEENPHGAGHLMLPQDKEKLLCDLGVKNLFRIPFEEVKPMEPEAFLHDVLLEKCKVKAISCGEDFRFGRAARGDVHMIRLFCKEHGVELHVLPDMEEGGARISSTRIRNAVMNGDISCANEMLGRHFAFSLPVVKGKQIGRTLGTPTINQPLPDGFIQPKFAIYASIAVIEGKRYEAVTNIGVKPTVGSDVVLAETWIPAFSGDLYGQWVKIELVEFIRPEVKFNSLEELKDAIYNDADIAHEMIAKTGEAVINVKGKGGCHGEKTSSP
ncbi:riboflavin biosynthesis protein RibF [Scatolibacter rhodanostii]|uniref:riboflavin biosynthesis protein RibF n=1 Tax=Scatolibacter rhodanostii TaxID=2014781 RepID=UPI0013565898|nr:riboflavin biosynthesis protein RibF [Scatolibacter rhodanostii]